MRVPLQVAFITGQSDPTSCALSARQRCFLDTLPLPATARVPLNFPYDGALGPRRDVSLLTASWHNARQYFASRRPEFAERHRPAMLGMLNGADVTVLLAGSCGLELLAGLSLPSAALDRVRVFAYGAVARDWPAVDLTAVRGRRDWLSRAWGGRVDATVECAHLDYLDAPATLALCRDFIARVGANASVPSRCETLG